MITLVCTIAIEDVLVCTIALDNISPLYQNLRHFFKTIAIDSLHLILWLTFVYTTAIDIFLCTIAIDNFYIRYVVADF